jgi:integrase
VLRAIFNYAVTNDIIGRNPCRGIKLPEIEPLRPHIVTADELHRLVDGLGGVGAFGPMAFLGTIDGLRWGEVAALRVGRLDFEASTVAVAETVVRGRGGANGFGQPKSAAGRRVLAVPVDLMVMLVEHMDKRGLSKSDTDALLFAAPEGGALRYSNWLRRIWYPATIAAGLGEMVEDEVTGRPRYRGLGFHDLRRANATGLVAEGVDIKTAQAMLGHSNPQLTLDLYAQSVASLGERAAEAMAARYFTRSPRENRAMEAGSDPDGECGEVPADGSDLGG